jgi:hypothetical protein
MIGGQFSPNYQPELNRLSQSAITRGIGDWFQCIIDDKMAAFRAASSDGVPARF